MCSKLCVFFFIIKHFFINGSQSFIKGRHGHDRVLVGFTTTYAITAYHH